MQNNFHYLLILKEVITCLHFKTNEERLRRMAQPLEDMLFL